MAVVDAGMGAGTETLANRAMSKGQKSKYAMVSAVIAGWTKIRPSKSINGMTVAQFIDANLKPCDAARDVVKGLELQMNAAINSGQIVTNTTQTFVNNRLVMIYPTGNPASLAQLQDLRKPGIKLVLAAKEVPVGQYALDFLDKAVQDQAFGASFKEDVLKNVVSYENDVKIVLTKVALGEADAGIVYTSDVSGANASKVGQIEIPDALNVIAKYPIAATKDSPHPDLARAFVDYVLSPEGQTILAKYGFIPAKK